MTGPKIFLFVGVGIGIAIGIRYIQKPMAIAIPIPNNRAEYYLKQRQQPYMECEYQRL
jgi:hypothetical protein